MAQTDEEQGVSSIQGRTDDQRSGDIGPKRPLSAAEREAAKRGLRKLRL